MPRNITVTFDDGSSHVYQNAPDDVTPDQVRTRAQGQFGRAVVSLDGGRGAGVVPPPAAPAATPAAQSGLQLNQIPRQIGLTARYGIEGLGQAAEVVTEPIRQNITDPIARLLFKPKVSDLVTGAKAPQGKPLGKFASEVADFIGLPSPQGETERVVGDMTRMVAGGGGMLGGARRVAELPGMAGRVGALMAQNPAGQLVSAAGAGGASGASREAGGSEAMQAVAGVLGGLTAPAALAGVQAAGRGARAASGAVAKFVVPTLGARAPIPQEQVRVASANVARASGMDWAQLPQATRDMVERQVGQSLRSGRRLEPDEIMRTVDAELSGLTGDAALTTGQVTRDPMLYTQERNMRGVEISTPQGRGNPLMERFANQNRALTQRFDDLGAGQATEQTQAGETIMGALREADAPVLANVDNLFERARSMHEGRAVDLDRTAFGVEVNRALDDGMWGRFLPAEANGMLNDIATGRVPFTVESATIIDGRLGDLQRELVNRGKDAAAASIGVVRGRLQTTPFADDSAAAVANGAGAAARDAFDQARTAARARFQTIEQTPAMGAALDAAAPDNFVRRFVLNADARDLQALRDQLERSPEAMQQARAQVANHLRRAAFGENPTGDTPFAANRYMETLRAMGRQRLGVFFSPEEMDMLGAMGRSASTIYTQPAGAAVNNSNTGSAVMTMLSKLSDSPLTRRIPGARTLSNRFGEMRTEQQINQALSGQPAARAAESSQELLQALRRLPSIVGLVSGGVDEEGAQTQGD